MARAFDYRALEKDEISVQDSFAANLDTRCYPCPSGTLYPVDVSFFFLLYVGLRGDILQAVMENECKCVTPLCGVPPAVGVTSGEGAERRKPIVASTRPNHLRFCGQAIHVPSSFSWYSLTAHRDRDEPGYRLLLPRNPRRRIYEAFMKESP
ncbi:Uncharacterized protein DBV15_05765 [Temnothorax longispinosus]|uniref:Uncharacterized protein n=1 Tax=Temnothorax longispinosus TaxID=300112 RepID=A0A4S2KGD6_9HYME|nr:Uncharacterized protein DBV15_05765 [Temnothorax longispinosus]